MSDLSAPEIYLWQMVETRARELFALYGYEEVRTPVLERTDVFVRSLGDTTEVVQKEMYAFEDRGGRSVALRPEGTAGVIRFIAGGGPELRRARLYYMGPMFRAERPQAGRKRQFHQIGVEHLGEANPVADAECIAMQAHLLRAWGLSDFEIQVNTRGLPEDRKAVADGLRKALEPRRRELCEDCQRRYEENVLRILDCKQEACGRIAAALPPVTDFMSAEARDYFEQVLELLEALDVPVERNPRLVRGLDYYMHTVWEFTHGALGAQDAISGGGRYRIDVDGDAVDGVGFALGVERVLMALAAEGVDGDAFRERPKVWVVTQGERAFRENLVLTMTLRHHGVACGMEMEKRSMKAQMRAAGRAEARYAVIRGDREMDDGTFLVKDMESGAQDTMDMPSLMEKLLPDVAGRVE